MKIGEIVEVEGVKYIAQEEVLACKYCSFDYSDNADCYDKFGCRSEDKVIFVEVPLELLEKIEQLEKQIEMMKNCRICKYNFPGTGEDFDEICERCENHSEWKLNE